MGKKIFIILLNGLFILGVGNLSFAMMCGSGEHSKHQETAQTESTEHKHMESEDISATAKEVVNVGNKICPVSAEEIDEKLKVTYEYEGKIYNFCCASCIEEFKKDPEKYIKKVEEELRVESKTEKWDTEMMQGDESSHHGHGMHEGQHH